jgi:hypothetical protein
MKKLFTVKCPTLKGTKVIKDSDLFSWIDSDFENYGASEPGKETKKMELCVLEMDKNATFKGIFTNPDKMALNQEQILWFIRKHRDKLRDEGYGTFFLFKSKGKFFVARVRFYSGGALEVNVYGLGYDDLWGAECRHRVVTPLIEEKEICEAILNNRKNMKKQPNKAIKIPVRYEDVEAFREEMRLNGALEFMDGYDYGRVEEIKKVDLWLKNTINIHIVLSAGFLLGTLLIIIFK